MFEDETVPYPNEHAARQGDPASYARFAGRKNDAGGPGIDFIFGVRKDGKTEVQSIRFNAQKYSPEQAKKWLADHNFSSAEFEPATGDKTNQAHDTILQTLDRNIGKTYFAMDAFDQNVDAWSGIPVIYAQEHPNMDAFAKDPEAEVNRIKGRFAGVVTSPYIAKVGHPRLMATLNLFEDAEVQQLWRDGKLSHSTGFKAQEVGDRLMGPVIPSHILIFKEDAQNIPKDGGAFILNKNDNAPEAEERFHGYYGVLGEAASDQRAAGDMEAKSVAEKDAEAKLKEFGDKFQNMELTLAKKDEDLRNVTSAKDAEIAALKAKIDATSKAEADKRWNDTKPWIPEGWTHGEKENKEREELMSDPMGYVQKLGRFYSGKMEKSNGPEGKEHVQGPSGSEDKSVDAQLSKLVPSVDIEGR